MNVRTKYLVAVAAFVALALPLSASAAGGANRTWVSGVGDDLNPCSRTAPCMTFAGALAQTADGGEIEAIDPGGFGPVTINQALTIDGGGTFAGILAPGTNGVVINAPGKVVRLRNLSIDGVGSGTTGVFVQSARAVYIQNVAISGFSTGVRVAGHTQVTLLSSEVQSNTVGLDLVSGRTSLVGSTVAGNSVNGMQLSGGATAYVRRSTLADNTNDGLLVQQGKAYVDDSSIEANGIGIEAQGSSALVRVSRTTIVDNDTGLASSGGAKLLTRKDNTLVGNGTQGSFTGTYSAS